MYNEFSQVIKVSKKYATKMDNVFKIIYMYLNS